MQTSKKKHRENKKEKEAQGNVYSKDINIQGQFQMKEKHRDSFKGKVNTGTVSKEREPQGQFQRTENHRDSFKGKVNTGIVSRKGKHRDSFKGKINTGIVSRKGKHRDSFKGKRTQEIQDARNIGLYMPKRRLIIR